MTKESIEYEAFVAKLIEGIQYSGRKIDNLGWGTKNEIRGESGVSHQIDVSFVDYSFPEPTLILIECKRYKDKNPIELAHIKVLQSTIDDIAGIPESLSVKGIFITTTCVQSGASTYAQYYGIKIAQLPHSKNFTFEYENIISIGLVIGMGKLPIVFSPTILKRCQSCGERFEAMDDQNSICPNCSQ